MNDLIFWRQWPTPYRSFISLLFIALLLLITGSLVLRLLGLDGLIPWSVISMESGFSDILKTVSVGPFDFDVLAPKLIITEYFEAGAYPASQWAAYLGVCVTAIAVAIYLTSVSYFSRFWYIAAIAVLMGFVLFSQPESVNLFDLSSRPVLIIIFFILFLPSYYIHAFLKNEHYGIRLLISFLSVLAVGGLIYFFGEASAPFSTLYSYGILAPFFVILLFTVTVSHEIIRVFLKVTVISRGAAGKSRLRHFLILSLIYWVNILLSYLEVAHFIDWNYLLFDPYLLLSISTVIGFWGINKRAFIYKNANNSSAIWVLLYLAVALIAYSLIFYLLLSLNDPILQVIGDFIIYAHVAIGMAFLLYIIYNFMPLIEKGYDVEKVLYEPTNLPYFTYRLVGLIGIIALVAIRGLDYPVWYTMGGYYNAVGDHYKELKDYEFAEVYYSEGAQMALNNHKANYNLAQLTVADDRELAKAYYTKAAERTPSAQAYLNLSNLLQRDNEYFKALFNLQEAKNALPQNDYVLNNLAVTFDKGNFLDSAAIYINGIESNSPVINTNKLGIFAKNGWELAEDSVKLLSDLTVGGVANATNYGIYDFVISELTGDYLYNKVALNNWLLGPEPYMLDSTLWDAIAVVDSTKGADEFKLLTRSLGLSLFNIGGLKMAIERMQTQIYASLRPRVDDLENLGLLYMSVGEYEQAIEPLLQASENGSVPARLKLAICYSEMGQLEEARKAWKRLAGTDDGDLKELATKIWYLLAEGADLPETDNEKLFYLRYRMSQLSKQDVFKIIESISSVDSQRQAWLFVAEFFYKKQDLNTTYHALNNLMKIQESNFGERRAEILDMIIRKQEGQPIESELANFESQEAFKRDEYLEKLYLSGLSSTDTAAFAHLAQDNPFFIEGVLAAANFYRQDEGSFRPYETLVEAIQFNRASVVLLKEYIKEAIRQGFDDYAATALERLKVLSPEDFPSFSKEMQEFSEKILQERELE